MTTSIHFQCQVHFRRRGRKLQLGEEPTTPCEPGRIPRVARLTALAIRFQNLLHQGAPASYSELAMLGRVTPARISQIMNLQYLTPDIQEAVLHLPRTQRGRDAIVLRDLQPIAAQWSWKKQRILWQRLLAAAGRRKSAEFLVPQPRPLDGG